MKKYKFNVAYAIRLKSEYNYVRLCRNHYYSLLTLRNKRDEIKNKNV